MGNNTKENRKKKENKKRTDFLLAKASFVSGIVVCICIIKDIVEAFHGPISLWLDIVIALVLVLLIYICLGKNTFDKCMSNKGIHEFGSFLTVCSSIVFIFENSVIKYGAGTPEFWLGLIVCCFILVWAIYLLISGYRKSNDE